MIRKTKTRQEIAEEYGINRRTLQRWLKQENIDLPNRLLGPKEQARIYQLFGKPASEWNDQRGRTGFERTGWR